jgi:hypothetical protein
VTARLTSVEPGLRRSAGEPRSRTLRRRGERRGLRAATACLATGNGAHAWATPHTPEEWRRLVAGRPSCAAARATRGTESRICRTGRSHACSSPLLIFGAGDAEELLDHAPRVERPAALAAFPRRLQTAAGNRTRRVLRSLKGCRLVPGDAPRSMAHRTGRRCLLRLALCEW